MIKSHHLFVGIDGGGTKTQAIIIDGNKQIIGESINGASNPLRVGIEKAITHIYSAISKACDEADRSRGDIFAAQIGIAGVRRADLRQLIKNRIKEKLRIRRVEVTTDAEIALYAATQGKEGLVIIAGTGSVCMGKNKKGEQTSAGGWGPIAGDEGGGAGISRRALQAIAKSYDGRGKLTKLSDYAVEYFRSGSLDDLSVAIYGPKVDNARIAGFAKCVSQAAEEGDEVAREVLAEAGRELGIAAVAVIEKLKMQKHTFPIGKVGSVFNSGNLITDSLMEKVLEIAPNAYMSEAQSSPAYAAAIMALQSVS